jgi:hypothetical protein
MPLKSKYAFDFVYAVVVVVVVVVDACCLLLVIAQRGLEIYYHSA